jgi:hypothetical protein
MVSYKWGGWSQSIARSFFHLLPGVWLDMQNLLPGQVVTAACAVAASRATVVFVFFTRNYVSRKNCMYDPHSNAITNHLFHLSPAASGAK